MVLLAILPSLVIAALPTKGTPYTIKSGTSYLKGYGNLTTTATLDAAQFYRTTFYLDSSAVNQYYLRTAGGVYVQKAKNDTAITLGAKTTTSTGGGTAATFSVSTTGANVLIKDLSTGLYLNVYYGTNGGVTLHSGTGDASQWKIVRVSDNTAVTTVSEGVQYYLQSQMSTKIGQYAYYDGSAILLQASSAAASIFTFTKDGTGYRIHNVSKNVDILQGSSHVNLTMGTPAGNIALAESFTLEAGSTGYYVKNASNNAYLYFDGNTITYSGTQKTEWLFETYTGTTALCEFPLADTYYTLKNCGVSTLYIAEESDGSLSATTYNVSQRMFWNYIPTGKAHCYYIQNATTGRYIQSTKNTSATLMKAGTTPVEFYVGTDATSGATTNGYYYMSSTDNSTYASPSSSTWALNKDGGSSNIIVWSAASGSSNSFWSLNATDNLYEIKPFGSSDTLGQVKYLYAISNTSGKNLTIGSNKELSWTDKTNAKNQQWYFVGTSNRTEGYLIASVLYPDYTLNIGTAGVTLSQSTMPQRWFAISSGNQAQAEFYFRPFATRDQAGTALTIDKDSIFTFKAVASDFSRSEGIYQMPCGNYVAPYVNSLTLTGEGAVKPLTYPISKLSGTTIAAASAVPSSYYTMFTADKATVAQGKSIEVNLKLSATPSSALSAYIYFDWNGDGVFETVLTPTASQTMTETTTVPADAAIGKTRMRVRLTTNGLSDAEDEVVGQIIDAIVNVAAATDGYTVNVLSNDTTRGTVQLNNAQETYTSGTQLSATTATKGSATFICWREGNNVLSVSPQYDFTVDHNTTLTAYFSPAADTIISTGISEKQLVESNSLINITAGQRLINIQSAQPVVDVRVYSIDGALLLRSNKSSIDASTLATGAYVVKVRTKDNGKTGKIMIK